jgi:hypothetical protein
MSIHGVWLFGFSDGNQIKIRNSKDAAAKDADKYEG